MTKMMLLDTNNTKLFTGTKQECKRFLRNNKVKNARMVPALRAEAPVLEEFPRVETQEAEEEGWVKRIFS